MQAASGVAAFGIGGMCIGVHLCSSGSNLVDLSGLGDPTDSSANAELATRDTQVCIIVASWSNVSNFTGKKISTTSSNLCWEHWCKNVDHVLNPIPHKLTANYVRIKSIFNLLLTAKAEGRSLPVSLHLVPGLGMIAAMPSGLARCFRRPERAITMAAVDKLRTLKTSQLFIGFSFMCLNNLKTSEHRKSFSFKIFIFVARLAAPWSLLPGAVAPLAHHSHTFCYVSISPIRIHSVYRALRDRLLGMRVCIPPGAIMFVLFVL
jgi:hypothetical protein